MASISSSAVAFREAEVVDELLGVPARGQARDGDEAAFLRRQLRSLPDLTEQDVIREAHERRCKVPEHPLGTRRFVVVCHCCSPLVCHRGTSRNVAALAFGLTIASTYPPPDRPYLVR